MTGFHPMDPNPDSAAGAAGKGVRGRSWPAFLLGVLAGLLVSYVGAQRIFPIAPSPSEGLAEPGLVERTARFAPALANAKPADLDRLKAGVDALDVGRQDTDLTLFAEWWTRFDPEAAIAWAIEIDERTTLRMRLGVLRAWAHHDPAKALGMAAARFYVKNPSSVRQQSGLWMDRGTHAALIGWDESLIPGIEEWVFDTPNRQDRQGLMQILAESRVVKMEPEALWEWAAGLPALYARDMLPRVASALAERNPELAVRLAAPYLERDEFVGLPRRIASRWARRDPRAALDWLATIPEGLQRVDGVTECARTWLSSDDRQGFMAYMEQRVDEFPEWLEPGFGLYARALMRDRQPESGLRIAAKIQSLDLRNYTLTLILRVWLVDDRAAAESWVEKAGIPEKILRRARFRSAAG